MRAEIESYFLNYLRLTPEERIRKLDNVIKEIAKLKASVRIINATK
jgi:hypothetical protein